MFGQDDTQQPQDNAGSLPGAMPDPINMTPPATNPPFGTPIMPATPEPIVPTSDPLPESSVTTPSSTPIIPSAPTDAPAPDAGDLLDLKQQALQQLSPLVSHLDQTPEEKFRTTMMMIQASDDQSLVKTAFEAAQKITDDKARAQALLDVINEINYFTQHQQQTS